jgi:hypothetical protein
MKMPAAAAVIAAVSILSAISTTPAIAQTIQPDSYGEAAVSLPQLYIAQDGVSLSQFPARSNLSKTVTVQLTGNGPAVTWVAHSNAPWLTVTPSGRTVGSLTLKANPAGLKKDTLHSATVTVAASASSADKAFIVVSLWVGSTNPGTVTITHPVVALATNPVQPLVYVSSGGSSVDVYNVYSGALVKTFTHVAPTVGHLAVGSIGTQLFAADTTNYQIVELDTSSGKVLKRFPLVGPISADFSFAYARPHGNATLFAPDQSAINVGSGQRVSDPLGGTYGFYDPLLVATPDGSKLAIVERGLSPGSLYTYGVSSSSGRLTFTAQAENTFIAGENCQSLAMTADGTRLYPACGWPYQFDVYDGTTLKQIQTLPAVPYPDGAVIDTKGNFVGGVNGLYETDDVFVYDAAGYLVGAVPTTTYSSAQGQGFNLLAASADSTRVISATGAPYGTQVLMFRNLP